MRQRKISDVMTTDVVSVPADLPFKDAVRVLAERHISGAPVVDGDGVLLGVVSEVDLMRKEARLPRRRLPAVLRRRSRERTVVGDLLTRPAVTTTPDTTVVDAARVLVRHGIARLPVVDEWNRLVGIVSPRDLLGVFLRADAEIADAVKDAVERELWIAVTPATVSVAVHDGVVTLTGHLERRSMVANAMSVARRVDGVVDVIGELAYAEDDSRSGVGRTFDADAAGERWHD